MKYDEATFEAVRQRILHETKGPPLDIKDLKPETFNAVMVTQAAEYGMSVAQFIDYVAYGHLRIHEDAPDGLCGVVSPFDSNLWCRLPKDHAQENHDPFVGVVR